LCGAIVPLQVVFRFRVYELILRGNIDLAGGPIAMSPLDFFSSHSRKMPPAAELCEECAHIPFDDLMRDDGDLRSSKYILSPLSDLQDRQCPFCRLVTMAILWAWRTDLVRSDGKWQGKIELRWDNSAVPGFRPAFTPPTPVVAAWPSARQGPLRHTQGGLKLRTCCPSSPLKLILHEYRGGLTTARPHTIASYSRRFWTFLSRFRA